MILDLIGIAGLSFVIISFMQKSIKLTYLLNSLGGLFLAIFAYFSANWVFFVLEISVTIVTAYDFLHWKRGGKSKIFHKK
jgi:hypothetical protein